MTKDTSADRVLISQDFYYFGKLAPTVPGEILNGLGYKNGIGHRKYDLERASKLVSWIRTSIRPTAIS